MPMEWTTYACLAIGLCSALVAGVFQSFSDFVMRSLLAAKPTAGIEAMQQINRKVYRSVFLPTLIGLVPITAVSAIYAYVALPSVAAGWIMAGAAIYIVGVFLVTMLGNVPMNNKLDQMSPTAPDTETYWSIYGRKWTKWNHVRTIGSAITSVCFLLAGLAMA
jgi:uncharacterized membrane protein